MACPPCTHLQAVLQQLAEDMFPEGQGKPNAKAKLASKVPMINGLFVNTKDAIKAVLKRRYELLIGDKHPIKELIVSKWIMQ